MTARARSYSRTAGAFRRGARKTAGFSLIELLVVTALIALLAGLLLPTLGAARTAVKRTETKIRFSQWAAAIEQFQQEYGYYPAITGPDGLVDAAAFLAALTARDHLGATLSDSSLAGNTKSVCFYSVANAELVKDPVGAPTGELCDPFGNSEIVLLYDADANGVISGAELIRRAVRPGNSQSGFGAAITPDAAAFPVAGVRARVLFYSAGHGRGADDFAYSWR